MIKTFCDPFYRAYAYLEKSDIKRAIDFFGPGLFRLTLNPMYLNEKGKYFIDYPYPENVEVVSSPGVGGWEIWGEVKDNNSTREGQLLEKSAKNFPDNTPDNKQDAKTPDVITSGGKMTPPDKNNPVDFDYSASKTISSYENDSILTKRGFNPSFRKKFPPQKEMLPL